MLKIDQVAAAAAQSIHRLLPEWLPEGQERGGQWRVGGIDGSPGGSLAISMRDGSWYDHATGEKGGDLVALRAAMLGVGQLEAARDVARQLGIEEGQPMPAPAPRPAKPREPERRIGKPPADAPMPPGNPDHVFQFRDVDGSLAYVIQRWDARGDQKKRFAQWSWDLDAGAWVAKAYPSPRPFFGSEMLRERPTSPVCITEGELKCLAARRLLGHVYIGAAWTGGATAVGATDWSMLAGRKVLIWPDNDEAGESAAQTLAGILHALGCEVKILDPSDKPAKWDAADCDMDYATFRAWAAPRVHLYQPPAPDPKPVPPPEPPAYVDEPAEPSQPPPPTGFGAWEQIGLRLNAKGNPFPNLANASLVLQRWEPLRGICWWDRFHGRIMRRDRSTREVRPWTDRDTLDLTHTVQDLLSLSSWTDDLMWKAVQHYAANHSRDELADWIAGLQWDGIERIASFLPRALGCADTAYSRSASANFWLSMVARATRPGCKVDTMLVLEGGQGKRKSTALAAIAGERFHTEAQESVTSKDFFMCLSGKLLVEIAELDSFGKAEATKVKQVISNRCDTYRAPYARVAEDYPRRCIFAGTTNESHYLRDSTGGRRFWPIAVGEIDLDLIRREREQCFAEAFAKLQAGASWWEMPNDETLAEQESRRQADTWEDAIAAYLGDLHQITLRQVLENALEIEPAKQGRSEQTRAAAVMGRLGWKADDKPGKINGRSVRFWRRVAT